MSVVLALARADVLERVRRHSFLVMTACVLWLGYGAYAGFVHVRLADWVGTWNSAWAGGMMAMVAAAYLSMIGFWFVRNAVARDESTGVGTILAATPMARTTYVLGKALSHFTVLALMAVLLFASAVLIQVTHAGLFSLAPFDFLGPLLFVTLPSLAITAACAIAFETTPGLRGVLGNVVWIALCSFALVVSIESTGPFSDVHGLHALQRSMGEAIQAQFPAANYKDGLSITLAGGSSGAPRPFDYPGMRWSGMFLLSRAFWLMVAIGIALLAAIPFHRFDPARVPRRGTRPKAPGRPGRFRLPAMPTLPPLPGLVGAELRLLFAGANLWWTIVLLGLWIAALLTPLPAARSGLLAALWLWGIPRWSSLGARDARDATEGFVLPTPGAAWRQPLAAWGAGVIAAVVLGAPIGLRLALAGEWPGLLAWGAGALFIPAFALACGAWSNSNKLFEALYVMLWYVGPVNRVPGFDYMGATLGAAIGPPSAGQAGVVHPAMWLALGAACVVAAIAARMRRLRA